MEPGHEDREYLWAHNPPGRISLGLNGARS